MPEDDKPSGGSSAPSKPIKAKLPSAQGIKRPDFTPHGLSSGSARGRGPKPSALTAAKAKKRQRIVIAVTLVAILAIAGGATWYLTRPGPELEVKGAFGKEPAISNLDAVKPAGKLTTSEAIAGTGATVAKGDTTFVHLTFYKFLDSGDGASASPSASDAQNTGDDKAAAAKKKKGFLGSTYSGEGPVTMQIGKADLTGIDKTLDQAMTGHKVGSRVITQVPPAQGFGKEGNSQLGVTATDTMFFAIDILGTYPKGVSLPAGSTPVDQDDKKLPVVKNMDKLTEAPKIAVPKNDPPAKLQVKVLVQGTGQALAKNDRAVVNYQGTIWKSGKVFDSSWKNGSVTMFPIGTGGTVPGFDKGLLGQKVGSRVLLVLPSAEGYGKAGQAQAGIKGDDTLVFVVDVIGRIAG